MTTQSIIYHRLQLQKISAAHPENIQSVVAYMGAIQAQDYPMAKWAVGCRLPNTTDAVIENALNKGEIVRTHVLRPTWHLVAAQDVRWMLALTGPFIKAASASRDRDLGIDASLYQKTNAAIVKALEGNKHLTRAEVMQELEKSGIATNSSLAVHFMMNAECDGLVCNGIMKGKEHTYTLLEQKILAAPVLHREEALATLAQRYFTSHAPATLPDFQWWSGLPMRDARAALESIKKELASFELEGKTYFIHEQKLDATAQEPTQGVHFLPAFDEYTVSYKDRSVVFDPSWHKEAITSNGIFKPIILINGQVKGIWKRTVQKQKVVVEPTFFDPNDQLEMDVMQRATQGYGNFLGMTVVIKK